MEGLSGSRMPPAQAARRRLSGRVRTGESEGGQFPEEDRNVVTAPATMLKRLLIVVHRWLGVALAAVFLLWFVSGIVMMYWTFPDVSIRDRLERAPALRADSIALTPEAAYAVLEREDPPGTVRLTTFDGRPVYSFGSGGFGGRGGTSMVYADTGAEQLFVDEPMLDRAAAAWSGRPASEARRELVEEVDQWTVGGARGRLPLLKYSWPDGQQLYIDEHTAEIVQYTTTSSRFWAYLGAIPHWFYFTPLRKHGPEWFSTVVWSSLIGTVAALMGVVIAIWMYSPRKRYRHAGAPTAIPYRGWKRWHTILGLLFGVVTTTWTFSGLLSMGPFPIMDRLVELTVPAEAAPAGEAAAPRRRGGRGGSLERALRGNGDFTFASYARTPADALASLRGFEVKEIEFTTFAGEPVYLARNGEGETRIVPMTGEPKERFAVDEVMRVVRAAAADRLAELRVMEEYDAYYLDRHRERPLPVVYARMNDAVGSRYYIDPGTARVVGQYNARNWVNRWLYRGLHSLDFPWLYNYRPLWDIVVITLMLGGTLLCVTSIVLAWRVLMRKIAALVRARMSPIAEDLAVES
jgi:hypothetical protein